MDSNFTAIKELIEKSDLSAEDKEGLISFFSKAKDEDLEATLLLFAESPWWIGKVNDNYKSKEVVLSANDEAAWNKIIEEEEIDLKKMQELSN